MSASPYGERELDVEVAEALGWKWSVWPGGLPWLRSIVPSGHRSDNGPGKQDPATAPLDTYWSRCLPGYSTDPAAYIALLKEMEKRGWNWKIEGGADAPSTICTLEHGNRCRAEDYVMGKTLGEAVCRAVLAALEEE